MKKFIIFDLAELSLIRSSVLIFDHLELKHDTLLYIISLSQ